MREQHRASRDRDIGRRLRAILTSPGINVFEEYSVRIQDICVGQTLLLAQMGKRVVELVEKSDMLELFDSRRIVKACRVARYPRLEKSPNGSNVIRTSHAGTPRAFAPRQHC